MKNKIFRWTFIALVAVLVSSCGLFRKKNKCMTCPHWSYEQPVSEGVSHS